MAITETQQQETTYLLFGNAQVKELQIPYIPVHSLQTPHFHAFSPLSVPIVYTDTIQSTQITGAQIRNQIQGNFVVMAEVQTGGEGRRGTTWKSERGGLWISNVRKSEHKNPNIQYEAAANLWETFKRLEPVTGRMYSTKVVSL